MASNSPDTTLPRETPPANETGPRSRAWDWRRAWRVSLVVAIALGVLDGAFFLAAFRSIGMHGPLLHPWIATVPQWTILGLLLGPAFYLADRFPLARVGFRGVLLVQIPAALAFAVVHIVAAVWVTDALLERAAANGFERMLVEGLVRYFIFNMVLYAGLVGSYLGLEAYRRYQERVVAASRLEAELANAQLHSLRLQLNPHFLFNSLNAISGTVMRRDPEHASSLIASLSHLLRRSLEDPSAMVPLSEELDLLEAYLRIEQARFGSRLAVTTRVEPGLHDVRVPSLLLQPLVENAVRHGVARRPGRGRVQLHIERDGSELRVEVTDSGPGFPPADRRRPGAGSTGVGIDATRRRLRQLFGDAASLETGNAPGGGARVLVTLPLPASGPGGAVQPSERASRTPTIAARQSTL